MKTKNKLKAIAICLSMAIVLSCSNNDDTPTPTDDRSFETSSTTDFFINRDGTVTITVSAVINDGANRTDFEVVDRGFVFGTSSMTEAGTNNTVGVTGPLDDISGRLENLTKGTTYYIRGFLKMSNGSYFYGNEIQVSTGIDASASRILEMEMKPEPFFKNSSTITPEMNITKIEKESPIEIGFQYSLSSDFSNAIVILDNDLTGNIFAPILVTEPASNLTAGTAYYFRPYAKYADGTITNGGTSTMSASTSN